MDVVVAGAGIAGLTFALSCHEVGVPVRLFESMGSLQPLGLGIMVQPNAVRELFDLGLEDELAAIGVPVREWVLIDLDGNDVWSEPCGVDAGCRWPQYAVHRGELEMMLYRAAVDRLGDDAIVTGRRVAGYEHTATGARVDLVGRDGVSEQVEGAVLIAADGLHSAVRAQMFPGEGDPRWGGTVLWRGMAEGPPLRGGASFTVIGDSTQRFVTFPISEPDPTTGLQMQNWIAEQAFDVTLGWRRGDWNTRVGVEEFIADFEEWRFDWLDVPALMRRTAKVFEYPMVDRDPVGHWVHGSVALIGDAAHAMYPLGSNGASQAIVDARVLAAAFVDHGVGRAALRAYEEARLGAMSALVLRNRELGPFSGLAVGDDAGVESTDPVATSIAHYKIAAGVMVDALNAAPPTIAAGARARAR